MTGKKFDQDKVRMELLEPNFVEGVAKVLTMGAKKYGANNWQCVEDARSRYTGALLRHITKYQQYEIYDKESGLHHLLHAACNIMFLLYGVPNEDTDIQRHKRRNFKPDPEPKRVSLGSCQVDPDEGDRIIKEHIQQLAGILDNGGSPEYLGACIDDFRATWGIEVSSSSDNKTSNG